jgi:hypothetical protein
VNFRMPRGKMTYNVSTFVLKSNSVLSQTTPNILALVDH